MAKPEFPPLLTRPPDFYDFSVRELRRFCVTRRPRSAEREGVMDGLEDLIRVLIKSRIHGVMWVDGSFVTEKIDPDDVDILLAVPYELAQGDYYQRDALKWFRASSDRKASHRCHTRLHHSYPEGHDLFQSRQELLYGYYRDQVYGISLVRRVLKGIVTIRLPEGAI